jgi:hypothetical protein
MSCKKANGKKKIKKACSKALGSVAICVGAEQFFLPNFLVFFAAAQKNQKKGLFFLPLFPQFFSLFFCPQFLPQSRRKIAFKTSRFA